MESGQTDRRRVSWFCWSDQIWVLISMEPPSSLSSASQQPHPNGKGYRVSMKDGSIITYREVSSSDGSPAVDINITSSSDDTGGVRTQKIHFVRKKED